MEVSYKSLTCDEIARRSTDPALCTAVYYGIVTCKWVHQMEIKKLRGEDFLQLLENGPNFT